MFKDLKLTLADHIASAKASVLIVAPYIKRPILDRLIAQCAEGVDLTVITVWELADLAAGVSDLDVWHSICGRRNARLYLCPSLHAKYYRADERVLVGSANITASALGVAKSSNLELLVQLAKDEAGFAGFENELFSRSIIVTSELYQEFSDSLTQLPRKLPEQFPPDPCKDLLTIHHSWSPMTRYPDNLFRYYCGKLDELTAAAKVTCAEDLGVLKVPESLTEEQFDFCIRKRLESHPTFRELLEFGRSSKRFGEVRALLSSMGSQNAGDAWQIWMRWLKKFTPDRFEFWEARYSEIYKTIQHPNPR